MILRRRFPSLRALLLGCATAFASPAAEMPPSSTEPIVELPTFVVTDSRELPPPESWRYATIPGFEILSNASDKSTQRLLDDLGTLRMALSYVWPMPNLPGPPTALILSGKGSKFDAFVTPITGTSATAGASNIARASLFLKNGERTAILLDVESTIMAIQPLDDQGPNNPLTGLPTNDPGRFDVDPKKQLAHEYVRFLLARANPRLPAWFEEGMAQLVMAMRVDPKSIEFGRLEDPNTVSAAAAAAMAIQEMQGELGTNDRAAAEERDFNAVFVGKPLVPLREFFAVTHDAPEAMNPLGNNRWTKQAYAFVHMCLYSRDGRWLEPLGQLLARSGGGAITEEVFAECFKMNFKDMTIELRAYVDFPVFKSGLYTPKGKGAKFPPPATVVLREATQSEIGRIKGETLVLAGKKDAARIALIAPYIRGERDPQLLAALGLYERAAGQEDRARKFLEAAVAAKTSRTEAYLELARLRFADAMAKPAGTGGRFSAAQVNGIVDLLMAARSHPVPMAKVYELLADTWQHNPEPVRKEEAAVLLEGARLFPGRMRLIYLTAVVCNTAGFVEEAHALAAHGARFAADDKAKKRFADLQDTFPPGKSPAEKK